MGNAITDTAGKHTAGIRLHVSRWVALHSGHSTVPQKQSQFPGFRGNKSIQFSLEERSGGGGGGGGDRRTEWV